MLAQVRTTVRIADSKARFAIIASRYNRRYVDGMLRAARATLTQRSSQRLVVLRVPGAFEIPVVAATLARRGPEAWGALICLGVILRGETTHAQHIGESVSAALAQIQVNSLVPIVHEVLLLENEEQAKVRCLSRLHNRGAEAAQTALEMVKLMRLVRNHA